MRRTTGVHQTTQTGPVSPIPQNMNNKTVFLGFSETGDYDKASTGSATGLRQVCSQTQTNLCFVSHKILILPSLLLKSQSIDKITRRNPGKDSEFLVQIRKG